MAKAGEREPLREKATESDDKPVAWWWRLRSRYLAHRLGRLSARTITASVKSPGKCLSIAALAVVLATPIFAPSYNRPPPHYAALESRCRATTASGAPGPGCANPGNEKIFISATLYDPEGDLVNGAWGESVLELITLVGYDNVFLSIYENAGGAKEEMALAELKGKLRCRHALVHDGSHHGSSSSDKPQPEPEMQLQGGGDFASFVLPDGSTRRSKRLAYLSEMRNRALRPLDVSVGPDAARYDKVVFLNDIAFRAIDAAHLIFNTNVGEEDGKTHYLAACGLDYFTPFLYYDTFALRDVEGYSTGVPMFPIFTRAGRGISRAAMLAETDAVPVASCWGGIVSVEARHVQNALPSLSRPGFREVGHHVVQPASPRNATAPVRFRYEPDMFYEACECCLFLADVSQVAKGNDGHVPAADANVGVYVNPYVRVVYRPDMLRWMRWAQKWERLFVIPQAILSRVAGMPKHNPHRGLWEGDDFMEEVWVGEGADGHWEQVRRRARSGMFCGTRKMLTIEPGDHAGNANWQSLKIPGGQTLQFG